MHRPSAHLACCEKCKPRGIRHEATGLDATPFAVSMENAAERAVRTMRAEIARFVGQRKLSITADVYTHVMIDGAELEYDAMLR